MYLRLNLTRNAEEVIKHYLRAQEKTKRRDKYVS